MTTSPSEKVLNSEQKLAVNHSGGPLLIIAGAGTGKTTVITERVKYLISQGLAQPQEILALTFTEKAAREMEERIDITMPYGYTQMWVMTFHSFCDRILRNEAVNIGLNPGYRLLTEADATSLLRRHLFDLGLDYFRPLGNPTKFISGILQHFSRLQDEDVSPPQYLSWVKKQHPAKSPEEEIDLKKYAELAHLYDAYTQLKIKEGLMDFADLITNTLYLFRTRPNVLAVYQKKFKYLLVDEFQDTNFAQNQLLVLLAGNQKNITVVGDDDQSIYKFRGAAVSNIIQFRNIFPKTRIIVLTQNYRSTQEILDRSYALVQHNNPDRLEVKEKINKKLTSVRGLKGQQVEFLHHDRVENEADAVAKTISQLINESQIDKSLHRYRDFAILVRANAHADPFSRALSRHGVPFQFLGPGQLFRQPEVKDLIAYLKVLANFEDSVSLYRVLAMDYFHLPTRDLAALGNFAKKYNLSLFEACEHLSGLQSHLSSPPQVVEISPFIDPETKEVINNLITIIHKHLALIPKETAGQILFYFLQDTGMLQAVLDYKHPIDEKRAENMMKFFNKLKTYEVDHEDASVSAVVDWIDLAMDLGESPLATDIDWMQNDAVNILTVHSAKGLEFPIVFLVNLVSQRFPSLERREQIPIPDALIKEVLPVGDYHLEEERRLFYVGMTRAKDKLFLTAADYYGEGKREKKLSPFVFEALGEQVINSSSIASAKEDQLSLLEWSKPREKLIIEHSSSNITPITYLSYSQIQAFLSCPLHYKARYILKIPTPPTAALSFGSSLHLTLKDFYHWLKLDPKNLRDDLEKQLLWFLEKDWLLEGYTSKTHERKFYDKGKKFLQEFLHREFNPRNLPELLEQNFTALLSQGNKRLKIGGKIDRVDVFPDGHLEIIDYKTGANVPAQKDVDTDLQLSFYAIAAASIHERPFGVSPENITLSLYYFDHQKRISTTRTTEQIAEATERIFAYADQISQSDFKCSGGLLCRSCEYKMLCDIS